jgi:hypothetical protein
MTTRIPLPLLCPSARCTEGAILLGIVGPSGDVAFLQDQLVVDDLFVSAAASGSSPESRFRFANRCVQGACKQWTGSRCGVVTSAISEAAKVSSSDAGRESGDSESVCSIRSSCRWFREAGHDACRVCSQVITEFETLSKECERKDTVSCEL